MTPHPINTITVETPVTVHNLTVFPIIKSKSHGPGYIPLAVAIEEYGLRVTETSEDGSVPNLLVENPSDKKVLLLDGEELHGAKQNRIINTTLLLAAQSKTVIDVSCTESGRWRYTSPTFSSAHSVMSTKARRKKTRSVSHSLQAMKQFQSDQGEVWEEVSELHEKVGSESATSAMSDAFAKMRADLDAVLAKIPVVENQCGLLAMIDGRPAGVDLISDSGVYAKIHPQLLHSYAMEAIAIMRQQDRTDSKDQFGMPEAIDAKAFLERCAAIQGKSYPSVALGRDWRFVDSAIVGSGLEFEDTWIHMAYFMDEAESTENGHEARLQRMARMSRRAGNKRQHGEGG